jgi:hypothetical protein
LIAKHLNAAPLGLGDFCCVRIPRLSAWADITPPRWGWNKSSRRDNVRSAHANGPPSFTTSRRDNLRSAQANGLGKLIR